MSIEIKNLSQMQARVSGDGRPVNEGRGGQQSGGRTQSDYPAAAYQAVDDQVTLTDRAKRLNDLTQSLDRQPVANQSRVDELRQAIQEGRYSVNSERIAGKLMDTEYGLGARA